MGEIQMKKLFDLTDGNILITNAEKGDVQSAVDSVKELLPSEYTSADLEECLRARGFEAEIVFIYDLERVQY
jgi:hypothetical protein